VLGLRSASAALAIREARPIAAGGKDVCFEWTADGLLTARLVGHGEAHESARLLASARAADVEAARFVETVDIKSHACVVVSGFGMGHHLRHLAHKLLSTGVLICFEPDVGLLRAVLERVDITGWLRATRFVLITRADDLGAMGAGVEGLEGLLASGVTMVDHPPSRARLASNQDLFIKTLTRMVQGVRTNVITTLAHSEITLRNLLGNASLYLHQPGIVDLKDSQKGRPAVVVSAGPSLRRNVELLQQPGVRDRVVIIAAQTVLKQLLAMGIKPHFVTALDYHEISTRFYEGLTRGDVDGVTLVVEPKANCAIPRAFPGMVRCAGDEVLARVMGAELAREMGSMPLGATVAHLSYYLARYLGCDPVLLIGQDLGFTDGQYYAPGAAIHQVWSAELNEFTSLESLEWQRIMRMRAYLRKVADQQGREVYTDEQMATYLLQFERDFQRDEQAGRTTVDATEGGVLKRHTLVLSLREAFEQLGVLPRAGGPTPQSSLVPAPALARFGPAPMPPDRREALVARLTELAQQSGRIHDACEQTRKDLEQMLRHHSDQSLVNRLIERVHERGTWVMAMEAHWLVQHLNQTGQLNRFKADRAIEMEESASALEKQKRQIERDVQNVSWLRDAATTLEAMLHDAAESASSGKAPRRAVIPQDQSLGAQTGVDGRARRVLATMWVDTRSDEGLFGRRDLRMPTLGHSSMLAATLARLEKVSGLDGVLIITDDGAGARSMVEAVRGAGMLAKVIVHEISSKDGDRVRGHLRSVRAARLLARHSWRTGIANLCVYDELFHPEIWRDAMACHDVDAALLVGPEWCVVDPALCGAVVDRYREAPLRHAFTFTQAPPGLVGGVVGANLFEQMSSTREGGKSVQAWLGTLGQLIGYHPLSPAMDPIAKTYCVQIPACIRDVLLRCCADDANSRLLLERLHSRHGSAMAGWSGEQLAKEITSTMRQSASELVPEQIVIRVCAEDWTRWPALAERLGASVQRLSRHRDKADHYAIALTIEDRAGDGPWREIADVARKIGYAGVHVRLGSTCLERIGGDAMTDAMDLGVDIVSIDMAGDSAETWTARSGRDTITACWEAMQGGLDERAKRAGACLPRTWFVPRLTRCDGTYSDIEGFMDRWMLTCGACAIDPLETSVAGDRIEPLPVPANVRERRAWSVQHVEAGAICLGAGRSRELTGGIGVGALEGAI